MPKYEGARARIAKPALWAAGIAALTCGFGSNAAAYTYEIGQDSKFDVNLTTTYTIGARTEHPSGKVTSTQGTGLAYPSTINYDDPDQNFHQGDLITNKVSAFLEAELTHGEFGVKASALAFYDDVYHRDTSNRSDRINQVDTDTDDFAGDTTYIDGGNIRLYDLFAYGMFHPFGTDLSVRAGNQVVAWGESLFFGNISLAQGPVDSTKGNFPGAEVKDILLPVPQIAFNWGLNSRFSLVGYYQFDYRANVLDGVGAYFSRSDVVGPGAEFSFSSPLVPNVNKANDLRPHSQGQYGVGTTFTISDVTSGGIYFLNYHDKNPLPKFDLGTYLIGGIIPVDIPLTYHESYASNVKLYGASLSTLIGGVNVGAEFAYRTGAATLVGTTLSVFGTESILPQPSTIDVWQANLNAIYVMGSTPISDSLSLTAEATYNQVTHIDAFSQQGADYSELYKRDKSSFGVQLQAELGYTDVFPGGWDMSVPINLGSDLHGTPAYNGSLGAYSGQGDTRLGLGVKLRQLNNLEIGFVYNVFFGNYDPILRPMVDRDFALASVKYTF
ncbi:DUF1302 domain-containing protein [Parvibaculum sp.]|uniref:DUF1302 domain-containing protein n=1 Tax=Parvibaculum sp. TaxID=2024848 RepID=UPI002BD07E27|nr:DUF1302 family protein [Parvibaculum sp.]HUD53403.1 DUF1302 family protein [Parvibaculum sp.]